MSRCVFLAMDDLEGADQLTLRFQSVDAALLLVSRLNAAINDVRRKSESQVLVRVGGMNDPSGLEDFI